jgi:cytochrome P450
MSAVFEFQDEMRHLVRNAKQDLSEKCFVDEKKSRFDRTIFHGILRSDLPDEELEMEMLKDHAVSLIAAGIASTELTMRTAFFHIVSNNNIWKKLRHELECAMPDSQEPVSLDNVSERLPYLTACIDEGMRRLS